jgi:DNA primase
MTINDWLLAHGLTREDLDKWHVSINQTGLTVPVHSLTGRSSYLLIRRMSGDMKYQVWPASARKAFTLYGLNRAAGSIIRNQHAIIVEGWSDVIAMHNAGFTNTVAIIGSRITASQAALIACFTNTVIAFGDGDGPGESMCQSVHNAVGGTVTSLVIEGVDPCEAVMTGLVTPSFMDDIYTEARTIKHRTFNYKLETIALVEAQ